MTTRDRSAGARWLLPLAVALLAGCGEGGREGLAGEAPLPARSAPVGQWYAGDLHVHNDHSSDGSAPRQCCDDMGPGNTGIADQILISRLSGLDFLPLTDHRSYDQHYDPAWESDALLLIRGEEANGGPHATVHGAIDTVVQGANPPGTPDFVNLQQSIWDAHAQGAAWITAHPDDGELEDDGVTPNIKASALGVDLVEVWNRGSDIEREMAYAENRWNAGYRFGVAGASDNHFRELWGTAGPGMPVSRVFASALTERALIQGLRAGRTSLSADPLSPQLILEADLQGDGVYEALGGDEVFATTGTAGRLRITVSNGPGTTLLIYAAPGRDAGPLASFELPLPALESSFELEFTVGDQPNWYRAELRGIGPPSHYNIGDVPLSLIPEPATLPDQLRAASSPIFVSTGPVEPGPEVPVPADAGRDDGARIVIGAPGHFAGFADVAVAGGVTHVVAEVHEADGRSGVAHLRIGTDGSRSETRHFAPGALRFPRIAANAGAVWMVWQEAVSEVPHRSRIVITPADGGESIVLQREARAEHPDIAVDAAGRPLVVWQEIGPERPFDIMFSDASGQALTNLSGPGKQVQPANALDTRSARYPASVWPAISLGPDGRVAVAWQDNRTDLDPLWSGSMLSGEGTDPDNWQIMLRTRPAAAANWSEPLSLGADDRADRHPSLAFDGDGRLVVAWDTKELRSSGANVSLLAAVSADGGESFATPAPVALDEHAMSQWPRLGREPDGAVRLAWYDTRSADWRQRVMTARNADGQWQAATMLPSRGINTWPATDAGVLVFSTTRNATRMQRDPTQQIALIGAL